MAALSFDDLIPAPQPSAAAPPISFDDLIPTSQPSAATSAKPTLLQKLDTGARAINLGIPFSDRLTALEQTLPFIGSGKSYSENLVDEQAARTRLEQEHPNKALAGRVTGGLLTSLPAIAASPGVAAGFMPALISGIRQGAAYGAAEGLSDQPDLTDVKGDIGGTLGGAVKGGLIGGVAAPIGYGATVAASKVPGVLSDVWKGITPWSAEARATRALANATQADARMLTPDLLSKREGSLFGDFGDRTMMADTGPNMQNLAEKVAATPQGERLKMAVATRANNVDETIANALPGIIGPDMSAPAVLKILRDARATEGANLQPLFAEAGPVDVSSATQRIDRLLATLPPGTLEANALRKVYGFIAPEFDAGGGRMARVPMTDAATLQNAKYAIDNMINFGDPTIGAAPGSLKNGALKLVAGDLNQSLRDQVQGYGDVMDWLSGLHRQSEGLQYGQDLLDTGKTAINPADSAKTIAGMPEAEQNAVRAGATSEIYRQAGAPANKTSLDTLNALLPNESQTGANWNAEKIGQVYGQDPLRQLIELQRQGNQFKTAGQEIGGTPVAAPRPPVTPSDAGWMAYDAARGPHGLPLLVANAFNALGRMVPGTAGKNDALARALTAQGAEKDSIAQAIADLLQRRAAGRTAGMTLAPIFAGAGLGAFNR